MNIDGDLRLILYFTDTATHCKRQKISFYTVWAYLRHSANGSNERSGDGRKLLRLTLVYCDSGLSAFFTLISALSDKGLDALAKSYDKFTAKADIAGSKFRSD
jgi:hypothetical protein